MGTRIIFDALPETFPEHAPYRKPSLFAAFIAHVTGVAALLAIPFFFVDSIPQFALLTELVAPPPPPPAALPAPVVRIGTARPVAKPAISAEPPANALITPVAIPQEIARFTDESIVSEGVVGGVPGGAVGGVIGDLFARNLLTAESAVLHLPPPPPPPPTPVPSGPLQPVRVGGNVREPRLVESAPPIYPKSAAQARVQGVVVLEAVVKEDGTVDAIHTVSGHPSLVEASVNCVKRWRYESTLLNGVPVRVVLTVRVTFQLAPHSD